MIYSKDRVIDQQMRLMYLETMEILIRCGMVEEAKKYGAESARLSKKIQTHVYKS